MKIAIDIREAGEGKTGKGWYNYNIVLELLKLDHENQYILYTDAPKHPFGNYRNATVKVMESTSWKWHHKVLKDLRNEKPDIYFAPTSYIVPAFAPKWLKVVITVHDLVAFIFPSTHKAKAVLIERLTLKKALKKAKAVFVVSENTRKDMLKRFDYPEDRITITTCAPSDFFKEPIDRKDLENFKKKLELPDNFILAVGTLEPRKNISTLIRSFVVIKRKYPDYKLVIVGKKGWKYNQIEATLKQFELEKEVIFPGYLDDHELRKMYALAKVFVFPSLYEGFGIPPLEAMASGCPVVSSNVASLPEVIGDAGLLIDPHNALKMADAVIRLLGDEQVLNMMIGRGKIQAEKFSWKRSAEKVLEVFKSLA